ncbi:hypothetical protein [Pseudomonas extremaustralis]|uniref:hypothetical protein n=1 Tax=Pseudomonas extremaustralis TaxID=359110 RepID=UPI002307CB8D|nr:hypothetical protein [Pseudomonas extremaustralis]MDB1108077.1 hypothetical protein [Pseudomonas extremaustralis]
MSERSEAKAAGEKFYFTGKPCRHGHIDRRQTSNGICYTCSKERASRYAAANPEKRVARKQKNKDHILKKNREWRERNRAAIKEKLAATLPERAIAQRAYYEKNKEKILAMAREKYAENKPAHLEYSRRRYARMRLDPGFRIAKVLRQMIRRLFIDKAGISTFTLVGYRPEDLKRHIEGSWLEGMTWDNYGDWHVDHVMPIKALLSAGVTDPAVINALSNLQPLWAKDNLAKGARVQ